MGLERKGAEQIPVVDKVAHPVADYQMTVRDLVVRADATAGAMTVTLPSVTEAKGLLFSIMAAVATPVLTVTVTDKSDSEGFGGDYTFVFDGNSGLFYSDGRKWTALFGGVGVLSVKTTILSADVLLLRGAPITLVPALGATKCIEFISATLMLDYGGSNAFTESADELNIKYTDGSGLSVSGDIEATNFIDATADTFTRAVPAGDAIVAATGNLNQALVLHNAGDGEYAGNAGDDNALVIWTLFRVIETG